MGAKYSKDEFINALRQAGVQEGALVMAHVGMSSLRALPEGVRDQEALSSFCCDSLLEVVGEKGTLCIPSFTYSLCDGVCYDPLTTPTETIGEFPEYFWRQPGVLRSNDPIMAVAAKGPMAEELLRERAHTSYGKDSFFDRFIQLGGVIVTIGVSIRWATIRYHITEMADVPFRYLKYFFGKRKINGQIEDCEWEYTVRPRASRAGEMSQRLGFMVEEELNGRSDLMNRVPIGRGYISCISAGRFKKYLMEKLERDPWASGDGISSREDIIREERGRTGTEDYEISLTDDFRENLKILAGLPKHLLSDGYRAAMDSLANKYVIQMEEWYTGEKVRGWIVPERWTCNSVEICSAVDSRLILSGKKGEISAVGYSGSFEGRVTIDELEAHLYYPKDTETFVMKKKMQTSYYKREWGICMSAKSRNSLAEEDYIVKLYADFSFDKMSVGVWELPGAKNDEILVVTHLDGEGLINFGLSGVMCGLEVFRLLYAQDRLWHTWRLLITPGPIGLAAWLDRHGDANIKGILFLDLFTTQNGTFTYMKAKEEGDFSRGVEAAVKRVLPDCWCLPYARNPFHEEWMKEKKITDIPSVRIFKMTCEGTAGVFEDMIRIEDKADNVNSDEFFKDVDAMAKILKEIDTREEL